MTKYEAGRVKKLLDKKDLYLGLAGDSRDIVQKKYDEIMPLFQSYYLNLLNEVSSRQMYDKALKTHKVDPYIAGGIGQGIGGVGGGIFVARSATVYNRNIDENREKAQSAVQRNNTLTSISETRMREKIEEL